MTDMPIRRRRRRQRRLLLLISLPVVIAVLVFAVKLLGLPVIAGTAISDYNSRDYRSSIGSSTQLLGWNFAEPYKPWFNRGDAYAGDENYVAAIDDFEKALGLAPADKKCDVSVNLSLSWEKLGDSYLQAGYADGAALLYKTARAVIAAAGKDCQPPNSPKNEQENRDPGQELQDADPRLKQKLDQAKQLGAQDPNSPETGKEKEDKLKEQGGQADQQKSDDDSRQRSGEGGGYTDKPW